jgi:hypothetical protein
LLSKTEAIVRPVRIILDGMPRMLLTMIRDIIATDADCDVVAEVADDRELASTLQATGASLVIVGPGSMVGGGDRLVALLTDHPRTRVLAIADDGRRAFVHELRPHVTEITELSPRTLLNAILQGAGDGARGTTGHG